MLAEKEKGIVDNLRSLFKRIYDFSDKSPRVAGKRMGIFRITLELLVDGFIDKFNADGRYQFVDIWLEQPTAQVYCLTFYSTLITDEHLVPEGSLIPFYSLGGSLDELIYEGVEYGT